MPDVVGDRQATAIAEIDDATLVPELTGTEASSTVGAGRALRQDPAPGTTVDAGTAVAYVLSTGPELVAVPDVEGQSQQDAADAVEAAGLAVGALRDVESDAVAAGAVDEQRPRAGQLVRPGTAVDLDVALGRVNDAPHITTDPTTSHLADGSAWTYDADATDADGVAPGDAGGDTLTWSLQAGPDGATIDPSTGVVAWTPEVGDAGAHDLAVRVDDGAGGLDVQSFTLTVTVPNRAPTAVDDLLDATVGQPRVIDAPELTDNDTDADGDALAIASYGQPQTGTLTQTGPQQLTYTPNQPDSTDVRTRHRADQCPAGHRHHRRVHQHQLPVGAPGRRLPHDGLGDGQRPARAGRGDVHLRHRRRPASPRPLRGTFARPVGPRRQGVHRRGPRRRRCHTLRSDHLHHAGRPGSVGRSGPRRVLRPRGRQRRCPDHGRSQRRRHDHPGRQQAVPDADRDRPVGRRGPGRCSRRDPSGSTASSPPTAARRPPTSTATASPRSW